MLVKTVPHSYAPANARTSQYGFSVGQTTWTLDPDCIADLWYRHMLRDAACQPMAPTYHTHQATERTVVLLGHVATAHAQRAVDGENLAARVCGYA
jgi:hypothetical protein